jgi:hypothetical protein
MEKNKNHNTKFGLIGIILRFPIFLIIACLKIFIAAPFEFIVKLFMLLMFVMVSILKYRYAVTFQNNRLYREWMDEWEEGITGFFHLNSFDFKETINFLKHGKFTKAIFKVL